MPQETFLTAANPPAPLAERLRPQNLDEFAGQEHLIGKGKVLRRMIEGDLVSSMIFWGPPGVGKTTLAQIIAHQTKSHFINFSAVTSGIKEIRQVMEQAESDRHFGIRTIVFVDEIHRFNKAQQDAFLPYVEKGSIILIGATTENPSFEVNSALLSRCRVFVLHALTEENVLGLLHRALQDERGFGGQKIDMAEDLLRAIAVFANGDAHLKNFSLQQTPGGDYLLAPAYDLLNTSIHVADEDFALRGGLIPEAEYSDVYARTGHPCRADFETFGRRIGVLPKKMMTILDMFSQEQAEVYTLIDRSFLDEKVRRMYKRSYQERLSRFVRQE